MILRFSLILALASLITAVIMRKVFTKKTKISGVKSQLSTTSLIDKLRTGTKLTQKGEKLTLKKNEILIPDKMGDSKLISDHAPVLLMLGYNLLGKGSASWYSRYRSMVKFDQIFLPFAIIICILGTLAKTIPVHISLSILLCSVTLNCLNNFYLTYINRLAMKLTLDRLSNVALYTKREDQEKTDLYLRSFPFNHLVPNSLKWIFR